MNQSTFNETFAFFSDRLSKAVGVEEQEVVLSGCHTFWREDKS